MKKIMIFAAAAALLSLSSCTKEGPKNTDNGSPVFTAGINPGTKTTVNAQDGKVAWETSDVITITDGAKNSAKYGITKIDVDGYATFEFNEGAMLGAGPYTATYGTAPTTAQTYSATPGNLYMTASSETTTLTFNVQCALMEINLTKEGESVKKIEVTGTPTGESKTTYTLTCTEAVSIAEQKSFYIALPAGTYTKIVITDSEDKVCTLNVKDQGIPVTVNQIIPATFDAEHLDFFPKGALPGVFSVSATKKVYFSKGNLWADGSNVLHFEDAQWKSTPASEGSKDANHVSHFTWSDNVAVAVGDSNSGSNLFCDEANKQSVDGSGPIYYALSTAEWQYLFNYESCTNEIRENKCRWAMVNGVGGYVIAPDDFTGTLQESYADDAALAKAGNLVFLPAAGSRYCSSVFNVGDFGGYWSSTADTEDWAYFVFFNSDYVSPGADGGSRGDGYSVRLITESK